MVFRCKGECRDGGTICTESCKEAEASCLEKKGSVAQEHAKRAAKQLDKAEALINRWGSASVGELFFVKDDGLFALDYNPPVKDYVDRARGSVQGGAAQSLQQAFLSRTSARFDPIGALGGGVGDGAGAAPVAPVSEGGEDDGGDGDGGDGGDSNGDGGGAAAGTTPPTTVQQVLSSDRFSAAQALLGAIEFSLPESDVVRLGLSYKQVEQIIRYLVNPKSVPSNRKVYLGVGELNVTPGWLTRRDYAAEIIVTATYAGLRDELRKAAKGPDGSAPQESDLAFDEKEDVVNARCEVLTAERQLALKQCDLERQKCTRNSELTEAHCTKVFDKCRKDVEENAKAAGLERKDVIRCPDFEAAKTTLKKAKEDLANAEEMRERAKTDAAKAEAVQLQRQATAAVQRAELSLRDPRARCAREKAIRKVDLDECAAEKKRCEQLSPLQCFQCSKCKVCFQGVECKNCRLCKDGNACSSAGKCEGNKDCKLCDSCASCEQTQTCEGCELCAYCAQEYEACEQRVKQADTGRNVKVEQEPVCATGSTSISATGSTWIRSDEPDGEEVSPGGRRPKVLSLFPMMESQVLDLKRSRRSQVLIASYLAGVFGAGGGTIAADTLNEYVRRLESDAGTRTSLPVATGFSSGNSFGYRIQPAFTALADPSDDASDADYLLNPTTIPILIVILADKDEADVWKNVALRTDVRWVRLEKRRWYHRTFVDWWKYGRYPPNALENEATFKALSHLDKAYDSVGAAKKAGEGTNWYRHVRWRYALLENLLAHPVEYNLLPDYAPKSCESVRLFVADVYPRHRWVNTSSAFVVRGTGFRDCKGENVKKVTLGGQSCEFNAPDSEGKMLVVTCPPLVRNLESSKRGQSYESRKQKLVIATGSEVGDQKEISLRYLNSAPNPDRKIPKVEIGRDAAGKITSLTLIDVDGKVEELLRGIAEGERPAYSGDIDLKLDVSDPKRK